MDQKLIEFNKNLKRTDVPELRVGDIIRVHKKIKEGEKERIQVFKGLIISIKGKQSSSPMITVRRESDGIGVEITFPLYLKSIEKIDLLRHSKVRRSKLYYMRERSGKLAKMKAQDLTEEELKDKKAGEEKEVEDRKDSEEKARVKNKKEKEEVKKDEKKEEGKEEEKKPEKKVEKKKEEK